jgi:ribosomal protein L37E
MHTMQRGLNSAEYAPAVNDLTPPFALPGVVTWQGFQKRHPTFTSPTNYPVCTGFAAMIGQTFEAAKGADTGTTSAPAQNAAECCNRCRLLFNPKDPPAQNTDNVTNGHCGGFTFHIPTKMCHLGFTNQRYRPWTWDTHTSGARVSTCLKCGAKLTVDDRLT